MADEWRFFIVTDQQNLVNGNDRLLIRQLVMRNFFLSKYNAKKMAESEHSSIATASAKKSLIGKFRLAQPRQPKAPKRRGKRKETSGVENLYAARQEKRANVAKTAIQQSDFADLRRGLVEWSATVTSVTETTNGAKEEKPKSVFNTNPNAHLFDPFDVLPVPGSQHLDMLLKLHRSSSRANSMAVNARSTWWHFISNDAGLLHATLATWALYGMLVRGIEGLQTEKLRHKTEAIKEVSTKFGSPEGIHSDELVGTVLTLASLENLLGAYDEAQIHVDALRRMVQSRGGLCSFAHNDGLVRGIIWVDFHNTVVLHTQPSFPHIPLDPDAPPLPGDLLAITADTSPTTLLHLSFCAFDCFNMFCNLQRLALCISTPWTQYINRRTLSNLLYETEYNILSQPDLSRVSLDFDHGSRKSPDIHAVFKSGVITADQASVVEAILAAAQIFVYAGLREIPPNARIFGILLSRLKIAVDRPSALLIYIWNDQKNLNVLLWVLVIASIIAPPILDFRTHERGASTRAWWVAQLTIVAIEIGVETETQLAEHMRRVAWTDTLFGSHLPNIWRDVEEIKLRFGKMESVLGWPTVLVPERGLARKNSESTQASMENAVTYIDGGSAHWRRSGFEDWIGGYEESMYCCESGTLSEKSWVSEDTIDPRLLLRRKDRDRSMGRDVESIFSA